MTPSESYYDRITDCKNPELFRRSMIDLFFGHVEHASETARAFRPSCPIVLKWVPSGIGGRVGEVCGISLGDRRAGRLVFGPGVARPPAGWGPPFHALNALPENS